MTGKFLSFVSIMVLICSCSKDSEPVFSFQGVWVEKTLRLDTFDFEKGKIMTSSGPNTTFYFCTKPFTDPSLNPNYPITNSGFYGYYVNGDSIFLRSHFSSSLTYKSYLFQLNSSNQSFQIGKFYTRTGLTSSMLDFEKIQ
jgi:hypothetical protein